MAHAPRRRSFAEQRPGIGVDSFGGQVIDPTKNVADLVRALEATTEKVREADARRLEDLRIADNLRADDLRKADQLRLDQLAAQKSQYDNKIFDIQTVQVKTTSDLISAQLSKETGSLANQISAATTQTQGLIQTLSERIGKLEQERWTVSGRSSVADPALASALADMAASFQGLTKSEVKSDTRREGMGTIIAMAIAGSAVIPAVISFAGFAILHAK
jgi:hypothetical protein